MKYNKNELSKEDFYRFLGHTMSVETYDFITKEILKPLVRQ